jgi:hypothetical protein
MSLVVRAFPVLPGKEEAVRQFADALAGSQQQETSAFFRRFGIRRESWHLQHTPHGVWVIAVTEMADAPEAIATAYAASQHPFDRWCKDQVCEVCGVDPDEEPLGPPTEPIFSWDGREG